MSRTYDSHILIDAYIKAQRTDYVHEDFTRYYKDLLAALEQAFGLTLSFDGVRNQEARSLWMLFRATADSYLSLRSPRSNFLDDTLINRVIERLGEQGQQIERIEATIGQALQANTAAHLKLLDTLFDLLWEPIEMTVTSQDLLDHGFDDSKEPQRRDYYDYM